MFASIDLRVLPADILLANVYVLLALKSIQKHISEALVKVRLDTGQNLLEDLVVFTITRQKKGNY